MGFYGNRELSLKVSKGTCGYCDLDYVYVDDDDEADDDTLE